MPCHPSSRSHRIFGLEQSREFWSSENLIRISRTQVSQADSKWPRYRGQLPIVQDFLGRLYLNGQTVTREALSLSVPLDGVRPRGWHRATLMITGKLLKYRLTWRVRQAHEEDEKNELMNKQFADGKKRSQDYGYLMSRGRVESRKS